MHDPVAADREHVIVLEQLDIQHLVVEHVILLEQLVIQLLVVEHLNAHDDPRHGHDRRYHPKLDCGRPDDDASRDEHASHDRHTAVPGAHWSTHECPDHCRARVDRLWDRTHEKTPSARIAPRPHRCSRRARRACALLLALVLLDACSPERERSLPDIGTLRCASTRAPAAQPSSLTALAQVGSKERAPLHGVIEHSGHGRAGAEPPIDVRGPTRSTLARELRAAAQVACQLHTTDDATRAGYVMSASFTEGVGTHWTNWRDIDAPFDPARPAMLLYGPRLGETQLVGFSYWVRTTEPAGPVGFAGPADKWHRHFGLCFDRTGLLQRENVRSPLLCDGVYLNGADMWMLHAWVVPGAANAWGLFAALNPQLCRRDVADINRCPDVAGS
jgi:hypothetical protein